MRDKKLIIYECEVCGEKDVSCLEKHHIIPRTDINTSNKKYNLAVICSSCHSKHHRGNLKILGTYPSTKFPNNRTLLYELNGIRNVDIDVPYIEPKLESMKIYDKH